MRAGIRPALRALLPPWAAERLRALRDRGRMARARRLLEDAGTEPRWLDSAALDPYQRRCPERSPHGYDPESVARRGRERARSLLLSLPDRGARDFLELGCWDGMVSLALTDRGKRATAIDRVADGLDERAAAGGVSFRRMDAHALEIPDRQFDVVFSFDGFEHFDRPPEVLRECIRVLRPGGHLYLEFGPLYLSPWGAHVYRAIRVPYAHVLFREADLVRYAEERALPPVNLRLVNRMPIAAFRRMWQEHADRLERVRYAEGRDGSHVEFIARHPTCFRSKSGSFEDFVVTSVTALFRRIA